jgi:hypothetical protein
MDGRAASAYITRMDRGRLLWHQGVMTVVVMFWMIGRAGAQSQEPFAIGPMTAATPPVRRGETVVTLGHTEP